MQTMKQISQNRPGYSIAINWPGAVRDCKHSSRHSLVAFLFAGLLLSISVNSVAQDFGRFFYTPSERAILDRVRLIPPEEAALEAAPSLEELADELTQAEEAEGEEEPLVDQFYRIGGTLSRGGGDYTVWINDVAMDKDSLPEHITLLEPYAFGNLQIVDPLVGQAYKVKPGQTLNLTTGQIIESFEAPRERVVTELAESLDGLLEEEEPSEEEPEARPATVQEINPGDFVPFQNPLRSPGETIETLRALRQLQQ